ncbi:winged helix-turn-helix transcriptional regulator [Skermania sp. ID1734]|uniref:MarR family winged helix-turn-helix transcriptional regulator n=1 Tax=Skermania sp. ID1734 TaxID=2597516 RepID=UPI00117E6AEA|nr:MarR family winged helix-turn-helix transcriptional regulator [Skermania sp. ID1734]TSD96126.1 winged helix-turn-helix transcriptional regulator [Skermania sp. ID1734]
MAPDGHRTALARLEYELTLFSRHYLAAVQHRADQQLDRSAYLILTRLEAGEPLSLKELSDAFRLDLSTINRQVAAMRRHGLVERVPDPDGALARKIRATRRGLDMLAADRSQSTSGLAKVVEEWAGADVEELSHLVQRFNESIERLQHNPWPRPHQPSEPAIKPGNSPNSP